MAVLIRKSKLLSYGIIAVCSFLICASLFYFYIMLPKAVVSLVDKMENEFVEVFGDSIFHPIKNQLDIDEKRSEKIQFLFNELDFKSDYKFEVYVVNSNQDNAFAISGGKLVVFSGLLNKLQNVNQLIALFAHEMTHVNKRHILKNVSLDLSNYLIVPVLFQDVSEAQAIITKKAHLFNRKNYSKHLEKEADRVGCKMLLDNNFNPTGFIELLEILKTTNVSLGDESFKYFSSHPLLQERIDYIQEEIGKSNKVYGANKYLEVLFQDLKGLD